MNTPCVLCKTGRKSTKYSFQSTNSIHSNAPLISLIENLCDVTHFYNSNSCICEECYGLLNEMDAIKIRLIEISKQLEHYIKNTCKGNNTKDVFKEETIYRSVNKDILDSMVVNNTDYSSNSVKSGFDELVVISAKTKENIIKNQKSVDSSCNIKLRTSHCLESAGTPRELNHLISHSQDCPFICEICGQGFKQKAKFNIHINIHNGINPFTCVYCNKSFTQKGALVRHVPMHTGEKPFQCEACGKRFIHHSSFNVHKLSHTGEKNHKCVFCGLSLISTSHLKRHMRIHTGEKKFPCSVCGKRFAERYNLNAHQKLHQDQKSGLPKENNYSCQICDEIFKRKFELEEHTTKKHFSTI